MSAIDCDLRLRFLAVSTIVVNDVMDFGVTVADNTVSSFVYAEFAVSSFFNAEFTVSIIAINDVMVFGVTVADNTVSSFGIC